jgi:hypothetical protein
MWYIIRRKRGKKQMSITVIFIITVLVALMGD